MTVDEIRDRIKELRTAAVQRVADAEESKTQNEKKITEAADAMQAAALSQDHKSYMKAKREKAEAEDARDYFNSIIRSAQSVPTVSAEEYQGLYAEVVGYAQQERAAALSELSDAVEAVEKITVKYSEKEAELNSVLKDLAELPKVVSKDASGYFLPSRVTIIPDSADAIGKFKERLL